MPSLRQLLAAHGPLLLIDAASARIQVGWLSSSQAARWAGSDEESGVGVFQCLEQLALQPADAGAFVFCDGPGSVLGIRTAAMALRSWCVLSPRPMFAYHSLAVVAEALGRPGATIIADARRESWHSISPGSHLHRVPAAELAGELIMPDGFRHWSTLPAGVTRTSYNLAELLPKIAERDLFRATDAPDAFLHEEPSYATWTPQIHRAP
jgi:tRNA threonylcarbamoyladenosine biosynthesis protein TsaB